MTKVIATNYIWYFKDGATRSRWRVVFQLETMLVTKYIHSGNCILSNWIVGCMRVKYLMYLPYAASYKEIKENDYNLNISRYVDTFEEEEPVDMDEVKKNISNIQSEIKEVEAQMAKYLEELGL